MCIRDSLRDNPHTNLAIRYSSTALQGHDSPEYQCPVPNRVTQKVTSVREETKRNHKSTETDQQHIPTTMVDNTRQLALPNRL